MMVTMRMAVTDICAIGIETRIGVRRRVIDWRGRNIHRWRRDDDGRCADGRCWNTHGSRSGYDYPRDGHGDSNIDTNRYAGARRGSAGGCEGDCYYTD